MTLTFTTFIKVTYVHLHTKVGANRPNTWKNMNFFLVNFLLVNLAKITDRQTDRQKATRKSPLCICTGGLKNSECCGLFVIPGRSWRGVECGTSSHFSLLCKWMFIIRHRHRSLTMLIEAGRSPVGSSVL